MTLFPGPVEPERPLLAPFQEEAVEAILDLLSGRGGALLADGAGLGKSWVAAAVARAWEGRGGTSEIVAPAVLLGQWRGVAEMFGLAASIVSHDAAASPRAAAATGRERLVIVDEAHRFRNSRTRRYRSLALRSRNAAVLLVTATPICNAPDDLRALLGLIAADDALSDRGVPSLDEAFRVRCGVQIGAVLDELAIARDHEALPELLRFATAEQRTVVYRAAGRHARELAAAFGELRFPLVDPAATGMLRAFLWRRLESSVAALRATLERLRKLHARALECATRGVALNRASYRAAFGDPDAPHFQDILFPELWGTGAAGKALDAGAIRGEIEALRSAVRIVDSRLASDPKVAIVTRVVQELRGRRGLVFAQSCDTAKALWSSLQARVRCGIVTGRGCRDASGAASTIDSVLAMLMQGTVDVVVATDVGCEGLDLQAAAYVVHADLPWSPAKLEQRRGRISRIGQGASRIEEIVVVAEGSPVAVALRRKASDGERFGPRRQCGPAAGVSARIDRRLVADGDDEQCVVDLVERRAGRTARALRPIDPAGRARSLRDGRALAGELRAAGLRDSCELGAGVDVAVATWTEFVRSRELQPPHLEGASPHYRMLEAATRADLISRELVELLSRRYRAGTEMLIANALENEIDARAIEALVCALGREAGIREPCEASISGFIATRGWLRSAAQLRRGPS